MVRLEPLGVDLGIGMDETVMAAANRHGFNWPTVCNGKARCTMCVLKVLDGAEHASAPDRLERDALLHNRGSNVDTNPAMRLACQLKFSGPAVIRKAGVTRMNSPSGPPDG